MLTTALAAVALTASFTACTSSDSADASTLTVGFVVDTSWAQIPVAVDTGLFGKHNVKVKVVNF